MVFQERGRNGIIPSKEDIHEQITKFCNSRELARTLADRVGRILVERLAVVRPLSHSAPSPSEIAAGAAEVNPGQASTSPQPASIPASPDWAPASPAWAPTRPQPGSIPASPDWAPASPAWAPTSPQPSSVPASPGVSAIERTGRAPVPGAISIVNLTSITDPVPDTTPAARLVRASAWAANSAIRELVDLTIKPHSEPDEFCSSSDEADSGSDEAESEWEEYSPRSDDEDKSESEAEGDENNDRNYI